MYRVELYSSGLNLFPFQAPVVHEDTLEMEFPEVED
jgi:hypothetical protein